MGSWLFHVPPVSPPVALDETLSGLGTGAMGHRTLQSHRARALPLSFGSRGEFFTSMARSHFGRKDTESAHTL